MNAKNNVPKRILFIGNSATYVNDIPGTLSRLAKKAGYELECESVVKGGAMLSTHANPETALGASALEAIKKGFDTVILQDNGNCISTEERRAASARACKSLASAVKETGAQVAIYFRPPYGYDNCGYDPIAQCEEFDRHFGEIAESIGAISIHVNRAFAYAIKNTDVRLWGPDNGHTSEQGAYLAVCVFFAALFGTSPSVLDYNGLPEAEAKALQEIAFSVT